MSSPLPSMRFGSNNNNNNSGFYPRRVISNNNNDDDDNRDTNNNNNNIINNNSREIEQRFAKIVAEYEYKLLEERGRAQERETQLLEELKKEKAQLTRLNHEKNQIQNISNNNNNNNNIISKEEYDKTQQQLTETRELLKDAERRYQQEKRELLNLRTSQLKSETHKRGTEGDIISRAMQVMSEYESVIRSSEENSLARLAQHLKTFEEEWLRRAREFEEEKVKFEINIIKKTQETFNTHHSDLESISRALLDKTTDILQNKSEIRLEMEEQVMRHAEIFKEEYREILEKEFYDRCKIYDNKIAERERGWVNMLQEERKKISLAEQEALKQHETLHVKALEDAMKDLSKLREQLVREHQEQQTESMKELITHREDLQKEHEELINKMNLKIKEMQKESIHTVNNIQNKMKQLHMDMAAKEAEFNLQLQEAKQKANNLALEKTQEIRQEIEIQWSNILKTEKTRHTNMIQEISNEYQNTIDNMRAEQAEREATLTSSYEKNIILAEEAAEKRWSTRVFEAMQGLQYHINIIQELRNDNESMSARLTTLTQKLQIKEVEMEGSIGRIRREQEIIYQKKIEEMRQRYDKLLDEALDSEDGPSVSRAEHENILKRLQEWEEKCLYLKQQYEVKLEKEREELNKIWGKRLEEEQEKRVEWETELQEQFTSLREAFLNDVQLKEKQAKEARKAQSNELHKELLLHQRLEQERCNNSIEEAEKEANIRCNEIRKQLEEELKEKANKLEERISQREKELQTREEELRLASQQIRDEAQLKAIHYLKEEKNNMQTVFDDKFAELYDEQQRWEAQRSSLEINLITEYSNKFTKAKSELEQHLLTIASMMLSYQEEYENNWLQIREKELNVLNSERIAYKKLIESQRENDIKSVQTQVEATLQNEYETIKQRENILQEMLQNSQNSLEENAKKRAMEIIEEYRKILNETNTQRAQEQLQKWNNFKSDLLEKTWAAEAAQREITQQQQHESEIYLEKEREHWRKELEQQNTQSQIQQKQLTEKMRQQEIELNNKYNTTIEAERRRYENIISQQQQEYEKRIHEERQRIENILKERENAFEAERRRIQERMEKYNRDQTESTNERIRVLQEEMHNNIRSWTVKIQQNQQEYMQRVSELEQKHLQQLQTQEKDLQRRYEENINTLRNTLEARVREITEIEADTQHRIEIIRERLQEESEIKYRDFITKQQEKIKLELQTREAQTQEMQLMYHEHLTQLRNDIELTFTNYVENSDTRAREVAAETRKVFENKLHEYNGLLQQEQQIRIKLEEQLRNTQTQMEELKLTHEEQRLCALREMQNKYETLYTEMFEAFKTERQEWARRALHEEEKRLLKEISSHEERNQRYTHISPSHANNNNNNNNNSVFTSGRRAPFVYDISPIPKQQQSQQQEINNSNLLRSTPQTPYSGHAKDNNNNNILLLNDLEDEKIIQLWSVLEVPEVEQQHILRRWSQLPLPQREIEIQKETKRLEFQLPILELVTRREFVIHRLKELERNSSGNNSNNNNFRYQLEEMRKELIRLTEYLKSEIPQYEATHGCTFRFRGSRYMDTLLINTSNNSSVYQ